MRATRIIVFSRAKNFKLANAQVAVTVHCVLSSQKYFRGENFSREKNYILCYYANAGYTTYGETLANQ